MTTRRSTLVPVSVSALLLGLVCGLVLGSLGAASAAGLTRGTVKRIAGHVVNKQAPSLSVAHATTADTATNAGTVGGATAQQLGVRPIVFTIPMGASHPSGSFFH